MSCSTKRFVFFFRIYLSVLFLHMCIFPSWCFYQRTCMAQGLVNGVFNESWTHSWLQFEWFSVGYGFLWRSFFSFSLSVFTLVCFTPHLFLIFDMMCVCVYVCVGVFWISLTVIFFSVFVCLEIPSPTMCMCGSMVWNILLIIIFFTNNFCIYICMYVYIYIYIYIYIGMFVSICVCMIHVLFHFGLNLSLNFFSFIWSSV